MKYDKDGIPCGLEDIEHIPQFIELEDSDNYFQRLKKEILWQKKPWKTGRVLPRLVCAYDRSIKCHVLEELIDYIETVLESDVVSVWCNLYRNGEDYTPYHQDNYACHSVCISFGESRKFSIREKSNRKSRRDFLLKSGDLFYFSPEINRTHEHTVPKTKKQNCTERISILFFMNKPYSHRDVLPDAIKLLHGPKVLRW